jgi:transcriptional regulator with XRE-family HTH domain
MKFGDVLKELLEQHGLPQKEFAQILGFTPSALSNYIHNTREPDYDTLVRISDYFHVSVDFLLDHNVNNSLTHSEEQILNLYRSLTPDQKEFYFELGKIFEKQNSKTN